MSKSKEEARESLLSGLVALREAVRMASETGEAKLAIVSVRPDKTGNVTVTWEAGEFFEDLALVLDAPEPTEEQLAEVRAMAFLQQLGLSRG